VTAASDTRGREGGLSFLHDRLDEHFTALRALRDAHRAAIPLFALEHGLSETELLLLKTEVCSAVRSGRLPADTWLPFVVYAAEIGYEYSGDEYWQTFEARTPSWAERGDRHYIRRRFRQFSETYGGAIPTGPWANWFTIICWPITHAVLPTDLQRYLARLLFEYRSGLTTELLHDPAELGKRLAARAWQSSSSRFQNFAQNTELLGQVAAALLVGDDESSPYLLDSTLKRIVADLSQERESRRWLRDAKVTASDVRTRGLARTPGKPSASGSRERLPATTDPELSLLRGPDGWRAYIEFPDLTTLAERLPSLHEELGRLRAIVLGVNGAPLARGRVLHPGQRIPLDGWPQDGVPVIALENGSREANMLLAGQCALPDGPVWLFRVRDERGAAEVRGKFVRPGRSYILVSGERLSSSLPAWIEEEALATTGACAYGIRVPEVLDSQAVESLQAIGVAAITEIGVRPAGLVAALWDGEGTAEWNAGEDPVIAVSSSRTVEQCIVTIDGEPHLIAWPAGEPEIFIQVDALDIGTHDLRVALVSSELERPVAEGSISLMMRSPPTRRSVGTFREGLLILATPISPTLSELWDGKAAVEVRGPREVQVKLTFSLADRVGKTLGQHRVTTTLPVDGQRWANLFNQIRHVDAVNRVYEQAESALIEVAHPELGSATLRCEREFSPLRWAFGRDSDGPFVRLIDNTDGSETKIEYSTFASPDRPNPVELPTGTRGRWPTGGLLTATSATGQSSVVAPPHVHDLDDLRSIHATPRLARGARSVDGVRRLIELSNRWMTASLPADPFGAARRTAVLRAITAEIAGLIGGDRWGHIEHRLLGDHHTPSTSQLREAVGEQRYQRELALDLDHQVERLAAALPERRAASLALALRMYARPAGMRTEDPRFAEFLLRLASEPASLLTSSQDEFTGAMQRTLNSPVLLRAARFVVLRVDAVADQTSGLTFAGWAWE
jgi:hypothetical protein